MSTAADVEHVGRLDATDARALTDQIKVGVEAVWQLITRAYTERAWDALGYSSWDDYCTREFGNARLRLPREERAEVVSSLRDSGLSLRAIASATGFGKDTVQRDLSGVANATPAAQAHRHSVDDEGNLLCEKVADCIHCGRTLPLSELYEGGKGYECDPCVSPELVDAEPVLPPDPYENVVGLTTPRPRPVIGLDNKTYKPRPATSSADAATETTPRRRPLEQGFFDATMRLNKAVTSLENLGKDDRLPRNKNQVARYRNDLIRAADALQRIAEQLA